MRSRTDLVCALFKDSVFERQLKGKFFIVYRVGMVCNMHVKSGSMDDTSGDGFVKCVFLQLQRLLGCMYMDRLKNGP